MLNYIKKSYLKIGVFIGLAFVLFAVFSAAHAQTPPPPPSIPGGAPGGGTTIILPNPGAPGGGGNTWLFSLPAGPNNFSSIALNVTESTSLLPGLLSGIAYLIGILLGVKGVLKLKEHVENPRQTPLQQAAISLAVGGALFALPIIFEAMQTTIDGAGTPAGVEIAQLNAIELGVN